MTSVQELYLAGGCFWGVQASFAAVEGVLSATCGYANGHVENPTYEQVRMGRTGHVEAVRITFDPAKVRVGELVAHLFSLVDPTLAPAPAGMPGSQYRTGVFYKDEALLPELREAFDRERARRGVPLATELAPLTSFFEAEERHQNYLGKAAACLTPRGLCQWLSRA